MITLAETASYDPPDPIEWGSDVAPTALSMFLTDTSSPAKPTFLMADNPFQCSCQMQWLVNPSNGDRWEFLKKTQNTIWTIT